MVVGQRFLVVTFFATVFLFGQNTMHELTLYKFHGISFEKVISETNKETETTLLQQNDIGHQISEKTINNQWVIFIVISMMGITISILLLRSMNAAKRRQLLQEKFSQDLIQTQENERTRLARELHDGVGQKLMLLTKKVKGEKDPELIILAENILEEIRSVSRALHPSIVERLGVTGAIRVLVDEVDASSNILFISEIDEIDGMISNESSLHLYRIVQEVLNNLIKYSKATTASVNIYNRERNIKMVIKDNGVGFNFLDKYHSGTSLGMKTIMERSKIMKSQLNFISSPDSGTVVHLIIPAVR